MKLLVINAHPMYDSKSSYALAMYRHLKDTYLQNNKDFEVEEIALYNSDIPQINPIVYSIWDKRSNAAELNDQEKEYAHKMQAILAQFKSAKRIVILLPVHNFNIPAKLKDYLDNILIVNETFHYTENGPKGLMTDGRKVLVVASSGSIYTNNDHYTKLDYCNFYLQSIFVDFIGFSSYDIVRSQGTGIVDCDKTKILEQAYRDIDTKAQEFLSI